MNDYILYITDVLKFASVPAAAYEFLNQQTKLKIENWIVEVLPNIALGVLYCFLFTYFSVFLLVIASPYLLIIYYIIPSGAFSKDEGNRGISLFLFSILLTIIIVPLASLDKWVFTDNQLITVFSYPYETFSAYINKYRFLDIIFPDYISSEFVENFEDIVAGFYDWRYAWFEWMDFASGWYFFSSKGVMILVIIFIQISLILTLFFLASVCVIWPFNLFIKFSNKLRLMLSINRGNIPFGAFILWASGEIISLFIKTIS